ncbi:MAG: hypothetical protein NZ870_04805, partial [bacterium]|nr:hypothetical protein [bacterium]
MLILLAADFNPSGVYLKNFSLRYKKLKLYGEALIKYNLFKGIELRNSVINIEGIVIRVKKIYIKPFYIELIPEDDEVEVYGEKIKISGRVSIKATIDGSLYVKWLNYEAKLDFVKGEAVIIGVKNIEGSVYIRDIKKSDFKGSLKIYRQFSSFGRRYNLVLDVSIDKDVNLNGFLTDGINKVLLKGGYDLKNSMLYVLFSGTTSINTFDVYLNGVLNYSNNLLIIEGSYNNGSFYFSYSNRINEVILKDIYFSNFKVDIDYKDKNGYINFSDMVNQLSFNGVIRDDVVNFNSDFISGFYDIKTDYGELDLSFNYKNNYVKLKAKGRFLDTDIKIYDAYINNFSLGSGRVFKTLDTVHLKFRKLNARLLPDRFLFYIDPSIFNPRLIGSVNGVLNYGFSGDLNFNLNFKGVDFVGNVKLKKGSVYFVDGRLNNGVINLKKVDYGYSLDLFNVELDRFSSVTGISLRDSFSGRVDFYG